jgi:uncharacterized membrane protein
MKNIIAAIFKNESDGYQMITELRKTPSTQQAVIAQMVLVKRENGTFNVCDRFDGISQNAEGTIAGGLIGAVVGLLGGPLGVLLMGATGALAGSMVDLSGSTYGEAMLETVATKMMDGEVALIILAEENDEAFLDALLGKFDAMILRYDAVDVADEVEEAAAMQKEMARQARQQLRESKREERKQKNEEKREAKEAEMEAEFEEYKKNLSVE